MNGPLAGIRVIDVTTVLSGPLCTMMLADAGADVIKVEPPGGDPARGMGPPFIGDEGAEFLALNRNKRSIGLDLKTDEGRAIIQELARHADIFVENFRPGTAGRLGLDYETLQTENPSLIYASISGFGQTGPRSQQAAYDSIMQAFVGVMHTTGEPGTGPTRSSASFCDISAGMYANQGILLALAARANSGKGQRVEASMMESQVAWLLYRAVGYFATGSAPRGKMGSASAHLAPYRAYATNDRPIMLGALNDRLFVRLLEALDLHELIGNPDYRTNQDRVANRDTLDRAIEARLKLKSATHWEEILVTAGIPCSRVNSIEEFLEDEQVEHSGIIETIRHPTIGEFQVPGSPIDLSATPCEIRYPPPTLGQHTGEILDELGLDLLRRTRMISNRAAF